MAFTTPQPAMLGPPMKNCTFVPASFLFEKDDALKVVPAGSMVALVQMDHSKSRKRKSSAHASIPRMVRYDWLYDQIEDNFPTSANVIGYGILYDDVVRQSPHSECEAYASVVVHGVCNLRTGREAQSYDPGYDIHDCVTVVQAKSREDQFVRVMINSARSLFV